MNCNACNQPIKANSLNDIAVVDNKIIHSDCLILPSIISCCLCGKRHLKQNKHLYVQIKSGRTPFFVEYYICQDCLKEFKLSIATCKYCKEKIVNFSNSTNDSTIFRRLQSYNIRMGIEQVCVFCYSKHKCQHGNCQCLSVNGNEYCYKHLALSFIHNYSHKPNPIFYSSDAIKKTSIDKDKEIYIGVELEVNFQNENDLCDFINSMKDDFFFYFKHDGSLKKYGLEIVSHPADYKYHIDNHWKKLFNELNKYHVDTDNCGLHFHFSKNAFQQHEITCIDYIVNGFKQIINDIGGRNYNTYAQKYCGWFWGEHRPHKHYDVCNLSNLNTIELRFCKSTSNYKTFIKRLKSIYALVLFCKEQGYILNLLTQDHCKETNGAKNLFIDIITNQFNQFKGDFLSNN